MLLLTCPFCGPRSENEFVHGGPCKAQRPDNSANYTDREWVEYLTVSTNPIGPVSEKWWHVKGCGEWIIIKRDTLTHEIDAAESSAAADHATDSSDAGQ